MYRHILVPTDGSPLSQAAVEQAAMFAAAIGARITLLHVAAPSAQPYVGIGAVASAEAQRAVAEQQCEAGRAVLDAASAVIGAHGVPCMRDAGVGSEPWEAIAAAAHGHACDLVFMASHGRRGVQALLLGSQTQKVLTHSSVPVLVYRAPATFAEP